jgi:hypothetical protein
VTGSLGTSLIFGQRLGQAQADHGGRGAHVVDGNARAAGRVRRGKSPDHGLPGIGKTTGRGFDLDDTLVRQIAGIKQDFQIAGADDAAQRRVGRR